MTKKIKNGLTVFCSIISFVSLLFLLAAPYLNKVSEASMVGNTTNAVLSLSPNTGTYKTNSNFAVDILINTHGQNVVVTSAYLNYSPTLFQVVSPIDISGSIFPTVAENIIDNVNGKVKLTIGIPTPGVNVTAGKIATLTIKGLTDAAPAADNFTFDFTAGSTTDSNVILNDGLGTEILSGVDNGKYGFDGTPPANVTAFTATAGDSQVSLSWTNPASDFAGVKILSKTGSYPTSATDGTVVYNGISASYVNTGLANATTYYYLDPA